MSPPEPGPAPASAHSRKVTLRQLEKHVARIREALGSEGSLDAALALWREFIPLLQAARAHPIPQIDRIIDSVEAYARGRDKHAVVILDHGCGGCFNLACLMALGYGNVWGVDIGGRADRWNQLHRALFGSHEPRFFIYDGLHLPLPDESVDFVLSTQVVEHLADSIVHTYYREEGRVLKPKGTAFHEAPHRFGPFDSHTGTWFVHYLPRFLRGPLYQWAGADPVWASEGPQGLHVRSPFFHRRMARRGCPALC